MLLVPAHIGPSARHGLGLFATGRIAAGSPVWRFTPGFDLDLAVLENLPEHSRRAPHAAESRGKGER
jgi:hypothetical protein